MNTRFTASDRSPVIGLTGRRIAAQQLGVPRGFADAPVDAYFSEYATAVGQAGGLPIHLALDSQVEQVAEVIDGLLLSGGEDVDPVRYGTSAGPMSTWIDPERDDLESRLLAAVVDAGKPVLGICRGAQLVNVARGGTLVCDLPVGQGVSHASYAYPRDHRRHDVQIEPGSLAHELYGPEVRVNSFHHQAVGDPGRGVRITGRADDGVAEVIEVGQTVLGVQWHPECLDDDPSITWLVRRARTHQQTGHHEPDRPGRPESIDRTVRSHDAWRASYVPTP